MRVRLLLPILLSLSACPMNGTMQTAETTGAGNFELGIEPGVPGVIITSAEDTPFSGFFDFSVSGRYGVSEGVDVGARVGTTGAELLTKFALLPQDDATVLLSLAPTVGGFALGAGGIGAGFINWKLPLILGIPLGDHQIVLGPRVSGTTIFAAAGSDAAGGTLFSAGTSVGFSIRIGKMRLLPEFSFSAPFYVAGGATGVGSDGTSIDGGYVAYRAGLGFLFGGRKTD